MTRAAVVRLATVIIFILIQSRVVAGAACEWIVVTGETSPGARGRTAGRSS